MSPTIVLFIGGLLVLVGITLSLSLIGVVTAERRGVARSLTAVQALDAAPVLLKADLDKPFSERVVAPLGERLVGVGRRIMRAGTAERIQHRLDIAGNPPAWDVNRIIGLKVLGLLVIGVLAFLWTAGSQSLLTTTVSTAGLGSFGYVLPNILVYNAGQKRETLMQRALPDALDLLTISVEAGLGFDAAVMRVARNTEGPLAQEFSRLLQEMQLGVGRMEAMRAMAERTTLADLKSFCLAMVQADQLGIPIGRVLRIQSHEMRVKRRQRAEEKAQKVPVKIMVPLVLFILPCLFIVVIGPGVLRIVAVFSR
ncbi:type II secretion system F family protein [Nocardioides koreensis]|uniref:Type II secretion system F family protein n=1 Tax=Nocardioides koreensis TaxID=433651 RepID=A0ABP5LMX2_9ACTN